MGARRRRCCPTRASAWPVALRRSLGLLLKEQEDTEEVLGAGRGARPVNPIEGFLAEWAPIPEKRIDFLTALARQRRRPISRGCTGWRG